MTIPAGLVIGVLILLVAGLGVRPLTPAAVAVEKRIIQLNPERTHANYRWRQFADRCTRVYG